MDTEFMFLCWYNITIREKTQAQATTKMYFFPHSLYYLLLKNMAYFLFLKRLYTTVSYVVFRDIKKNADVISDFHTDL